MTLPQRPLRGSRISTFYPVKNLPSLYSLDSAFQLQEYISLLIRLDVHDVEAIVSLPGKTNGGHDKEKTTDVETESLEGGEKKADDNGKNEVMVDEACWIYEQLRRLAQDLTHPLITMLQQECTRASCPEMKAGEWLYLCVAHGNEGAMEQCCAIDYILHTLDSATALLNTPRAFPSRLQIPPSSHRHFSSLARRLGRIFAHAYYHHREAFEQAEAESSLYARFLALTSKFELVPAEFLVIPQQRSTHHDDDELGRHAQPTRTLGNPVEPVHLTSKSSDKDVGQDPDQVPWNRLLNLIHERGKSPGVRELPTGGESPRKIGRSRTDTMVLHEGFAFAEEMAKMEQPSSTEDDLQRPVSILLETESVEPLEEPADIPRTIKSEADSQPSERPQTEDHEQTTDTEETSEETSVTSEQVDLPLQETSPDKADVDSALQTEQSDLSTTSSSTQSTIESGTTLATSDSDTTLTQSHEEIVLEPAPDSVDTTVDIMDEDAQEDMSESTSDTGANLDPSSSSETEGTVNEPEISESIAIAIVEGPAASEVAQEESSDRDIREQAIPDQPETAEGDEKSERDSSDPMPSEDSQVEIDEQPSEKKEE